MGQGEVGGCTALADSAWRQLQLPVEKPWSMPGGCTALADSAWRQLQLPVEKPWSMPGGPFVCFLAQTGVENAPFTL